MGLLGMAASCAGTGQLDGGVTVRHGMEALFRALPGHCRSF